MNREASGFQKLGINSYPRPEKYHKLKNGLRAIEEIPTIYRHIFAEYEQFNKIQSKVFDDVLYSNRNVIVSAPTGSGKTIVFELAIIQLLMELEDKASDQDFKIIYIAPIKALCTEKYTDWCKKFNPIRLSCLEVTGDSDISDFSQIDAAQLIVTTPEKWDSITRRWKDNKNMVESVKLFMIDEVHLLNEDGRGPILEAIVSRMKTIQFSLLHQEIALRFIAVSATIPNIEDMATWFSSGNKMSRYHRIAEELRPVELVKHVLGYKTTSSGFKFDMGLNYKLGSIVRRYSNNKPTLIFCSSRKAVEMASTVLYNDFSLIPLSDHQKSSLLQISKRIEDHKLRNMVTRSVAYHHAGLNYNDRNIIEDAFRKSIISVLVCTSTLAMGVNLPAHLVIIKSTETFVCGSVLEYSESSVLQMIGRAGRPQYDKQAVAVIMTQERKVQKYQNLINGCTPVESHLHKHLAEHLNSEIVLQTITNLEVAMKWIRSTFLYVRAVKCPMSYGLANDMTRDNVEKKLEDMCLAQINALKTHGLVSSDKVLGIYISSTVYGRLMARYYISFETMKLFKKVRGDETFLQILNTIVSCQEFSELKLRVSDKKSLNELNVTPIRYPIKGKIKTTENKISCLIQSILGNLVIKESSLTQDAFKIIRIGERIAKCLTDYIRSSEKELDGKVYKALLNSTIITKCIRAKLWENSVYVCKQLKKIGPVYSTLLVNSGKISFEDILETNPRNLEMILNKAPPFGNEIHDVIATFPKYDILLEVKGHGKVQITVKQTNEKHKSDGSSSIIIIGDSDNNLLLYHDKVDFLIAQYGCFDRTIQMKNVKSNKIHAHLIHEKLVGLDKTTSIVLNPDVDDNFEKNKKPKRKIQSKLKLTKNPRKTKSAKGDPETAKGSDQYISMFQDNEFFENIESDLLNNSPNKIENSPIKDQSPEIEEQITVENKLNNFEYIPRNKIPKNDDEENYIPENFNITNDTGYDEFNSQSQGNTDVLVLNHSQDMTELNNRMEHLIGRDEIGPKTSTENFEESNSCKKQKIPNSETVCNEKPFDFTKYLYESSDNSDKSQNFVNNQQNKNDDEKFILTQNPLENYSKNFTDTDGGKTSNESVPTILNVNSEKATRLPTRVKDFKKASEILSDYMKYGAYSSEYKYRQNNLDRKTDTYFDFRNSQKLIQKPNEYFNNNSTSISSSYTTQTQDENAINSDVIDLSKKTQRNDHTNINITNVSSKLRSEINKPNDFSEKLLGGYQTNEANSRYHKLRKTSECSNQWKDINECLTNRSNATIPQSDKETNINSNSKNNTLDRFLNQFSDCNQNLDERKVLSPYFQNNKFFHNFGDSIKIPENKNNGDGNISNFHTSQNSSENDQLRSKFEKIQPEHKNELFNSFINSSQGLDKFKEDSFSRNNSFWNMSTPFEANFSFKEKEKKCSNDEEWFTSLSQIYKTRPDTEHSPIKRNRSTETIDLTKDNLNYKTIWKSPLKKIRKETTKRTKEIIAENYNDKENICSFRPSDVFGATIGDTYNEDKITHIDDYQELDEKQNHDEYDINFNCTTPDEFKFNMSYDGKENNCSFQHKDISMSNFENGLSENWVTSSQELHKFKEDSFSSNKSLWNFPTPLEANFSFKGKEKKCFESTDWCTSLSQIYETRPDTEHSSIKISRSAETIDLTKDNLNYKTIWKSPLKKIRKEPQEGNKDIFILNDDKEEYNCSFRQFDIGKTKGTEYVEKLKRTGQVGDNQKLYENRKSKEYRKDISTEMYQSQNMTGIHSLNKTIYNITSDYQNIGETNRLNEIAFSLCDFNPGIAISNITNLQQNFNTTNMEILPDENDNNEQESIKRNITELSEFLAEKYIEEQNVDKASKFQYSRIVRLPNIDKKKNMEILTKNTKKIRSNGHPKETFSRNLNLPNINRIENNTKLTNGRIGRKRIDEIFDKIIINYEQNSKMKSKRFENISNRFHKKPKQQSTSSLGVQFAEAQKEETINTEDLERKKEYNCIKYKFDNNLYDNEEEYAKDLMRCKLGNVNEFRDLKKRNYSLSNTYEHSRHHNFQFTSSSNDTFLNFPHDLQKIKTKANNLSYNNEYLNKNHNRIDQETMKKDDQPFCFSFNSKSTKSQIDDIPDIEQLLNNNSSFNFSSPIFDEQSESTKNSFDNIFNNSEDFIFNEYENKFPF